MPRIRNKHAVPRRRASAMPLLLPIVLLAVQASALAAEAPITPGSVQDTLGTGARPALPAGRPQVVLPAQPAPSPHDPKARRFRVNAFDMSGNTVFRARVLKTLLERFVDMELNLYDLNKAADTITAFYHDRGYTLARAFIPAQKVENGVVQIHIVEGRFGKVGFSGNKRYSTGFLAARTGRLTPGTLVTTPSLEHDLLLLNDLPGLRAKAVLQPGAKFGATDADIKVEESLIDGSVTFSNHGRRETGQNRLEIATRINAPFGWGDQLVINGSATQQSLIRYWKFGYSVPLNTKGTRLAISTSKAAFDVAGALAPLGVRGEVSTTDLVASHPLARSRDHNETIAIGIKRNHLTQSALGVPILDSTVKVLTANYAINHIHEDSSVTNAMFGLATNFKSGNTFTKQDAVWARLEMDVSHTSPFIRQWDLYLRANFVHSKEMLPDTEKFSLGGPGSVRAFRSSEVRGDKGHLFTAELRRPFALARSLGVFRLTADIGEVIYKAPGFNDSRDRLRSVGFGATWFPTKNVVASFDVATPLSSTISASDGKNTRVWMNLSASF